MSGVGSVLVSVQLGASAMLKRFFLVFCVWAAAEVVAAAAEGVSRSRRIVGGHAIAIERAPFVASMEYGPRGQMCGLAVLNEHWLLTAAHCFGKVFGPQAAKVRVGSGTRNSGGTEHSIVAIRKYPGFNMTVVDNDVALIKVDPPMKYSLKVNPIRLVERNRRPPVGSVLTVLGWGYTRERGVASPELQAAKIPVYEHEMCRSIYTDVLYVSDQMLCAGYQNGGKDACVLDSGGPLIDQKNKTLVGVVSWGWGCARASHPGVYTDLSVAHINDWVQKIINTE